MINWKKKKKRTIIKLFQQNKIIDSPKTNSKTFSCFAGLLCNNKHFFINFFDYLNIENLILEREIVNRTPHRQHAYQVNDHPSFQKQAIQHIKSKASSSSVIERIQFMMHKLF